MSIVAVFNHLVDLQFFTSIIITNSDAMTFVSGGSSRLSSWRQLESNNINNLYGIEIWIYSQSVI